MTVVIDTNVLIQGLDADHPNSAILDAWVDARFTWVVSTDVLMEYEEVVTRMMGSSRWKHVLRMMDLGESVNDNLLRVATYFQFLAIPADRDDDKFADCAISAHADYVITEDRHFRSLAQAGYKTQPIDPQEFIIRHLSP